MIDWATLGSLATGMGTLVLAVATFLSVRSANRAAWASERALLAGILPVFVPSRINDPAQNIRFIDDRWVTMSGGHAIADATDGAIYLAISLRNVGRGLGVLDRWDLQFADTVSDTHRDPKVFRRLSRDIYVAASDLGFWQGALRDANDPEFEALQKAIGERRHLTVDLLYGDNEGGQRAISRFFLTPDGDTEWLASVVRHWRLDRSSPRCSATQDSQSSKLHRRWHSQS